MHHILLAGDSWACGEWGQRSSVKFSSHRKPTHKKEGYGVLHPGINKHLKLAGHKVRLIHHFANNHAITLVEEYLKTRNPTIIFFFVTDPLRNTTLADADLITKDSFLSTVNRITTRADFEQLHHELLHDNFQRLNKLKRKIYLIGGCQRIYKEDIKQYKNLVCLTECMAELVCPEWSHPPFWDSGWSKNIQWTKEPKSKRKWFDYFYDESKKQWDMYSNDKWNLWFYPDGHHPNRYSHEIFYKWLTQNVEELNTSS